MVRTALMVLALALGGGASSLGGFVDMVAVWAADEVEAGCIWDPFGCPSGINDGSDAENDAGNIWDPFG